MNFKEITTIEAAEKLYNERMPAVSFSETLEAIKNVPANLRCGMFNFMVGQVIVWSLNNADPNDPIYDPNFNNEEKKWTNWYQGGDSTGAGFRLLDAGRGWANSVAYGGARLCFRSRAHAIHFDKYFRAVIMRIWLNMSE